MNKRQTIKCVEYLEKHGGRLTQSQCRSKWPDGTVTDLTWQYSANDTILSAKTAMDAIWQHMETQN